MDKLNDPTLKLKYNKSKLKLKLWESDFRNRAGKNPCKDDIKEAPSEIRDAYKWYWQIKIHALGQDSMFDATFVEKTNSVETTSPGNKSSVSDSGQQSPCKLVKNLTPVEEKSCMQDNALVPMEENQQVSNKSEEETDQHNKSDPQPDVTLPSSVWGTHLNRQDNVDSITKKTNLNRSSSSFQLSEKLFVGAKLKKRNPRKSLSFSVGRMKEKGILVSSDSLSTPSDSSLSIDCSQGTEDGFSVSDLEKEISNVKDPQNHNFVIVTRNIVSSTQPLSAVQKIIGSDLKSSKPRIERNLDQGWLDRAMQADSILSQEAKGNNIIPENMSFGGRANICVSPEDSDDDIIYGSDNESKSPGKTEKDEKSRQALRSKTPMDTSALAQKTMVHMDSSALAQKTMDPVDSFPHKIQNNTTNIPSNYESNTSVKKRKLDAMDAAVAILTEKQKSEILTLQVNKKPKTTDACNEHNDNEVDENSDVGPPLRKKTPKSKKEVLEKKVASGTVNDNFVRINIQKKVFVRGKKTMNFQKYKKQQWKTKKKELSDKASAYLSRMDPSDGAAGGGLQKCYKCGEVGHFARQCTQMKGDSLIPHDPKEMEESPFPSLAEVAKMARETSDKVHHRKKNSQPQDISHSRETGDTNQSMVNSAGAMQDLSQGDEKDDSIPENDNDNLISIMKQPDIEPERKYRSVEPLYSTNNDGSLIETPSEVFECLQKFGHQNFRPGQEVAIMRILSGLSTLVTLSTGSGKSLCYQLPAYLFASKRKCITLVVSPLVSLMDDQISGLPSFIKGAALHTGQTEKQREKVIDMAKSGKLQFLLVSPEAVVAGERQSGFGSVLRSLPDIAFACIDEAHCVSQWSHNFRPSYLVLFKVLREKLGVQTILGLTATATQSAVSSIIEHVGIPDGRRGVIQDTPLPNNLVLTVSCDPSRDQALLKLVSSSEFEDFSSIIVYCTRREECERLAALLRTCLKSTIKLVTGMKISPVAEAYHAGFSSARRKQVQTAFMTGKLRIVVATVAFGMGINKADIRSVIHFNMPRNFESYVQEVGRAGRDGKRSRCHLFLSSEGKDMNELRRHINADSVDRHTIRKLLQRVFVPCNCEKGTSDSSEPCQSTEESASSKFMLISQPCVGHEVAFSVDETVTALDLPEENITTLLCYLELYDKNLLQVMPKAYTHCRIQSYKGMKHIQDVARTCPPLAMAIAMDFTSTKSLKTSQLVEFPVVEIASAINWDSGVVKRELKNLEWIQVNGNFRRSGIKVDFCNLGFRVKAPGNLSPEKLDAALDFLFERAVKQEQSALYQLQTIFDAVTSVSLPSVHAMLELSESDVETRSNDLKRVVRVYFQEERHVSLENLKTEEKLEDGDQIANDVRQMVNMYRDCNFTGRSVARIFHGISSPNFPAQAWGRCRFWRIYLNSDFKLICLLATRVLLQMR